MQRAETRAQLAGRNRLLYLLLAAGVWGFSWTMSAMLLYRPIVRAVGQRLTAA